MYQSAIRLIQSNTCNSAQGNYHLTIKLLQIDNCSTLFIMHVEKPPDLDEILQDLAESTSDEFAKTILQISSLSVVAPEGRYRHWDTLRHLSPPDDLTPDQWWFGIKMARRGLMKGLPLHDADEKPVHYMIPDEAQALLHYVDQHASGEIAVSEVVVGDESARRRYLVNSLIEEAIRSSQLEGATTTRPAAKEMIRTGRPPKDRSERMILNNYRAMEFIREDLGEELSPDGVLELQRILTEGTLENEDSAGRLQRSDEDRISVWYGDRCVHQPPPAEQLPHRLELMCSFANEQTNGTGFLHPVVRSIILHFWLAYDHPFEDGNGRTARALFYWSMKRQGYWLTEYLSISRILRKAPAKYTKAFIQSETDDLDITYFILYHLETIRRALGELQDYLARKMAEVQRFESHLRETDHYNHRQLTLLQNAVRHPDQRFTFESHRMSHKVSFATSRSDLLDLWEKGFLERRRIGRQYVFFPVSDLLEMLTEVSA